MIRSCPRPQVKDLKLTMSFSFPIASPSPAEKVSDQAPQTTNKGVPQCAVTRVYQAKLAELMVCNILVTWCKNLTSHGLNITVEKENHNFTCKIDLKTWQFWGKKGLKSFEIEGQRVDIFWDFRQAKFSSTAAEPSSDYYVAMVSNEEVVLLVGDLKKDAYKRARSRPSLEEATLLYKRENVNGKRLFCTRAMVGEDQKEHDIVVENSLAGPGEPEMWISVDGTVAVRIMNLNWRFRGNESVMVNNVPLQIFWDVHDWLFTTSTTPASGQGLFIFKPGTLDHPDPAPTSHHFRHFLYAWKTE